MTPARALTWIYPLTVFLVALMLANLADAALEGNWLLFGLLVPLQSVILGCDAVFICALRAKARQQAAIAEPRTPAFPDGKDCPAGCCPICGMEDPDGTAYAWSVGLGVRRAHIACVEWLGGIPAFDPVALDPDGDVRRQLEAEDPGGPWARRRDREEQAKRQMQVPSVAGIQPSEMREILREMGNPSPPPTERQIDQFIIRKAHEQERWELAAYRTVVGNPDATLPRCACGQRILACPACYTPYCPVCQQRHVFDCGRKWEEQQREIEAARELPPLHVDPELIAYMYGRKRKRGPRV